MKELESFRSWYLKSLNARPDDFKIWLDNEEMDIVRGGGEFCSPRIQSAWEAFREGWKKGSQMK